VIQQQAQADWLNQAKGFQNQNIVYSSGTSVRTLNAPAGATSYTMANLGQAVGTNG
jgi:hypothetical protein